MNDWESDLPAGLNSAARSPTVEKDRSARPQLVPTRRKVECSSSVQIGIEGRAPSALPP
jgi:hypothetical protein